MARFLRQQASAAQHSAVRRGPSGLACPTHVLFNGGVLRAQLVRERLLRMLNAWLKEEGMPAVEPLTGEDLMHAVARGARLLRAGAAGPRSAHPRRRAANLLRRDRERDAGGARNARSVKALTVVPFGMEEGTGARIPDREFGLAIGQPAEFRFFSSTARKDDAVGAMIEDLARGTRGTGADGGDASGRGRERG